MPIENFSLLSMGCENPNHQEHLESFLRKYPTAKRDAKYAILTVNPEDWAISLDDPKKNRVKCCQVCSISEDILRADTWKNEHGRYCSCQWDIV